MNRESSNKDMDKMTIKEALRLDKERLNIWYHLMADPAPVPFVPITPFVIGKKIWDKSKKLFR